MYTNKAELLGKSHFRRVWIASVLSLGYQLGNIIKGNQGDSFADKEIVKNLFGARNSKHSNANVLMFIWTTTISPIYYLAKIERAGPKAQKMEGVKESLFSAQHFGRRSTAFASVWVVTSKSLRKWMWAEYQVIKEIILRCCVCVGGLGVEYQRGKD